MTRILDERFLSPHPRTVLWQAERLQCASCTSSHEDGDVTQGRRKPGGISGGMRCSASPRRIGGGVHVGRSIHVYCIDAREPGSACGPEGRLFKPVK